MSFVRAAALSAVLLAGAALPGMAQAQITDVRTGTVGTLVIDPGVGSGVFADDANQRIYRSDNYGFGAGFAAYTATNSEFIYFENGAMSASAFNSAKAVTSVDIDFTNDSPTPQLDRLVSTIFESSFGFYVGEFNRTTGCSGATLSDCETVTSGVGFSGFEAAAGGSHNGIAGVSFAFDVLYDGALVRSIGGSIRMVEDGNGGVQFIQDFGSGTDALPLSLNGFTLSSDTDYSYIFSWDTTPFVTLFPSLLAPGDSATITYRITTESWSQAINTEDTTSDSMIIGFACVRDPVGRGGGSSFRGMSASPMLSNGEDNTCSDAFPDFGGNVLHLPEVVDGALVMPGVVPEPATWAMLIAGFGIVGAAARRRRPVSA